MTSPHPKGRYWDERLETLAPERRRMLREHRLHWQLRRCWYGSPFYRARLEAAGLDPATFNGTRDWRRLPPLQAEDLPELHAWAVAPEAWWDHVDAAPGVPSRVVTDGDAIHQRDLVARSLWAGRTPPMMNRGVSVAVLALTRPQLLAWARRAGILIDGDEQLAAPSDGWPFSAPMFLACHEGEALHWNDDHFSIETVDPASGEPVPAGAVGSVLVTDLTREGSPLLRYRTGLEAALSDAPCPCGRTSAHSAFVRRLE
jgi:hypothetical protein